MPEKQLPVVRIVTFENAFEPHHLDRIERAIRRTKADEKAVVQLLEAAKKAIWSYWVRASPWGRLEADARLAWNGPVPRRPPPKGRAWISTQTKHLKELAKAIDKTTWQLTMLNDEALDALFESFESFGFDEFVDPFKRRAAWMRVLCYLGDRARLAGPRLPSHGRRRGGQTSEDRDRLVSDLTECWRKAGLRASRARTADDSPFQDFVRACCNAAGAGEGTRVARAAVRRRGRDT